MNKSSLKLTEYIKFIKSMQLAIVGLSVNKMRTALSVLGIVIGVSAVIMIVSVGHGLQSFILNQLSSFGTNILEVQPKIPGEDLQNSMMAAGRGAEMSFLKNSDVKILRDKATFPYIAVVSGYISNIQQIFFNGQHKQVMMIGADSYYPEIDSMTKVEYGVFFTEEENLRASKVVVIGSGVAKYFFSDMEPIGQNIKINNDNYRVVGVLQKRGEMMMFDMDDLIIIPLKTAQIFNTGNDQVREIGVRLVGDEYISLAKSEITTILRAHHKIENPDNDDFQVITMDEMLGIVNAVTNIISLLLGVLAAISLVVGGIGVMNIMFVIVSERTKEIGLRKTLGARYQDIMRQFILEAILISVIGGILGIVLGVCGTFLITLVITKIMNLQWPFVVSYIAIFISFVIAVCFGIIFGWYPAREAARLHPIEALRGN